MVLLLRMLRSGNGEDRIAQEVEIRGDAETGTIGCGHPALQAPGPAAEGRSRPSSMLNKYPPQR